MNKLVLPADGSAAIKRLLVEKPQTFEFGREEEFAKRQATLDKLSKDDQEILAYIIYHHVLGYGRTYTSDDYGFEDWPKMSYDPHYYMAHWKDIDEYEVEVRSASDNWRLIIYSEPGSAYRILDVNGWPGDNESGSISLVKDGQLTVLAYNSDTSLDIQVANPELVAVLTAYEQKRASWSLI